MIMTSWSKRMRLLEEQIRNYILDISIKILSNNLILGLYSDGDCVVPVSREFDYIFFIFDTFLKCFSSTSITVNVGLRE